MIFSGEVLGHFLDVDPTFQGGDDDRLGGGPIHKNGEVELLGDVDPLGKIYGAHLATDFARLLGDEDVAEHGGGLFLGDLVRVHDVNAALKAILEGALAATTCVYLGLDHYGGTLREGGDCGIELVGALSHCTGRNGYAGCVEKLFGLVFVYVHEKVISKARRGCSPIERGQAFSPESPKRFSITSPSLFDFIPP